VFKVKKKTLITVASCVLSVVILAFAIPAVRAPILDSFLQPFNIITAIQREVSGLIFYHRNYVQNESLKKQNDFLRNKLNTFVEFSQENARLKEMLTLKQQSPFKVIPARVIARSADSWSSLVIVDKGANSGIKRGMVVVNFLGLIGRVSEVTAFTSKIVLINDPNISVSAMLQRSRQEGLISGTLGNYLIMRYLPEDVDAKPGDIVITSGLNELYPKGVLIGTVAEINKEFSGLSRYAIVRPAVTLSGIEEVLVIVQ
jgi:rod shape-determining protein MreC